MSKRKSSQEQKNKQKRPIEAPVVELGSMLDPEKVRQMPKYTEFIEKALFHIKVI